MITRPILFLASFCIVSIAEVLALWMNWSSVHEIAKPLIMLTLIGYYLSVSEKRNNSFVRAMFFCWVGDVLLMFQAQQEGFFMGGLVAFLVGHILYILTYRQLRWSTPVRELLPTQKVRLLFPVILAGTGLLTVLFPKLGPLTIPVVIYSIVLMLMVVSAVFRFGRTSAGSMWLVLAGAWLFMASDSILAFNKFHTAIEYSGPLIMTTYILAQFLIVEGARRHPAKAEPATVS